MSIKTFKIFFIVMLAVYCLCMVAVGTCLVCEVYPLAGYFTIGAIGCMSLYLLGDKIGESLRRARWRKKYFNGRVPMSPSVTMSRGEVKS